MKEIKIKRYFIKVKEILTLQQKLPSQLQLTIKGKVKKSNVEKVEFENIEIYLVNKKPLLAKIEDNVFPTLFFQEALNVLPRVVVNKGAIPYVCRGADIMRPGIVKVDGEFNSNSLVVIIDEKHGKAIALGLSLYPSVEIEKLSRGKVIRNLHFVGDKIWN
ncbi:RNA-binding protein, partial [Candidatus Bathyarchaeota archaeon]